MVHSCRCSSPDQLPQVTWNMAEYGWAPKCQVQQCIAQDHVGTGCGTHCGICLIDSKAGSCMDPSSFIYVNNIQIISEAGLRSESCNGWASNIASWLSWYNLRIRSVSRLFLMNQLFKIPSFHFGFLSFWWWWLDSRWKEESYKIIPFAQVLIRRES